MNKLFFLTLFLLFTGCAIKEPVRSEAATILIKTPKMRFYDKGFIQRYQDHIEIQIYNAGTSILTLNIYDDRICKDNFKCLSPKEFNKEFFDESYDDDFLKELFEQKKERVVFKDREKNILIKIIK